MFYSKDYFLKKFKQIKPKLEKQEFEDFYLRWYADGFYTGYCENEKEFEAEKDPEEERTMFWEPQFQAKREDSHGIAHLEAHLEDDGREAYWVLEITYYKKPFKRWPNRSPLLFYKIAEILEQHIKDIPKLIKQIK